MKRPEDRGEGFTVCHWLTWTMAVDVDRRLIRAQTARRGATNDGATLRPLADTAHRQVPMALVLADAECDCEHTHQPIRYNLQAQRLIPAKRGGASWRIQEVQGQMRQEFPAHLDRRRALIERTISAVKRKRSARALDRSLQTQCPQASLLGMAYHSYRLWCFAWRGFLRMSTEPPYG